MITERTLKKWRKEALVDSDLEIASNETAVDGLKIVVKALSNRILRMSQELLDQHSIRRD